MPREKTNSYFQRYPLDKPTLFACARCKISGFKFNKGLFADYPYGAGGLIVYDRIDPMFRMYFCSENCWINAYMTDYEARRLSDERPSAA